MIEIFAFKSAEKSHSKINGKKRKQTCDAVSEGAPKAKVQKTVNLEKDDVMKMISELITKHISSIELPEVLEMPIEQFSEDQISDNIHEEAIELINDHDQATTEFPVTKEVEIDDSGDDVVSHILCDVLKNLNFPTNHEAKFENVEMIKDLLHTHVTSLEFPKDHLTKNDNQESSNEIASEIINEVLTNLISIKEKAENHDIVSNLLVNHVLNMDVSLEDEETGNVDNSEENHEIVEQVVSDLVTNLKMPSKEETVNVIETNFYNDDYHSSQIMSLVSDIVIDAIESVNDQNKEHVEIVTELLHCHVMNLELLDKVSEEQSHESKIVEEKSNSSHQENILMIEKLVLDQVANIELNKQNETFESVKDSEDSPQDAQNREKANDLVSDILVEIVTNFELPTQVEDYEDTEKEADLPLDHIKDADNVTAETEKEIIESVQDEVIVTNVTKDDFVAIDISNHLITEVLNSLELPEAEPKEHESYEMVNGILIGHVDHLELPEKVKETAEDLDSTEVPEIEARENESLDIVNEILVSHVNHLELPLDKSDGPAIVQDLLLSYLSSLQLSNKDEVFDRIDEKRLARKRHNVEPSEEAPKAKVAKIDSEFAATMVHELLIETVNIMKFPEETKEPLNENPKQDHKIIESRIQPHCEVLENVSEAIVEKSNNDVNEAPIPKEPKSDILVHAMVFDLLVHHVMNLPLSEVKPSPKQPITTIYDCDLAIEDTVAQDDLEYVEGEKCSKCEFKISPYEMDKDEHLKSHSKFMHGCENCHMHFKNLDQSKDHEVNCFNSERLLNLVTDEITFSCMKCDKQFDDDIDLESHKQEHSRFAYSCQECHVHFSASVDCNSHLKTHEKVVNDDAKAFLEVNPALSEPVNVDVLSEEKVTDVNITMVPKDILEDSIASQDVPDSSIDQDMSNLTDVLNETPVDGTETISKAIEEIMTKDVTEVEKPSEEVELTNQKDPNVDDSQNDNSNNDTIVVEAEEEIFFYNCDLQNCKSVFRSKAKLLQEMLQHLMTSHLTLTSFDFARKMAQVHGLVTNQKFEETSDVLQKSFEPESSTVEKETEPVVEAPTPKEVLNVLKTLNTVNEDTIETDQDVKRDGGKKRKVIDEEHEEAPTAKVAKTDDVPKIDDITEKDANSETIEANHDVDCQNEKMSEDECVIATTDEIVKDTIADNIEDITEKAANSETIATNNDVDCEKKKIPDNVCENPTSDKSDENVKVTIAEKIDDITENASNSETIETNDDVDCQNGNIPDEEHESAKTGEPKEVVNESITEKSVEIETSAVKADKSKKRKKVSDEAFDEVPKAKVAKTDKVRENGITKKTEKKVKDKKLKQSPVVVVRDIRRGKFKKIIEILEKKKNNKKKAIRTNPCSVTLETIDLSQFACNDCSRYFACQDSLENHENKTHKKEYQEAVVVVERLEPEHECSKCPEKFFTDSLRKDHVKAVHAPTYECDVCGEKFAKENKLQKHSLKHTKKPSVDPPIYSCELCDKKFTSKSEVKSHFLIHMDKLTDKANAFTCDICNKEFDASSKLEDHHSTHHQVISYSCDICEKSFDIIELLMTHLQIHDKVSPKEPSTKEIIAKGNKHEIIEIRSSESEEENVNHKCFLCKKDFPSSKGLKQHVNKVHVSGGKKHTCEICKKDFENATTLARHKSRSHKKSASESQDHTCSSCDKTFAKEANLKEHIQTAHSMKRENNENQQDSFYCDVCQKYFHQLASLKRHLNNVRKCDYCPETFHQQDKLKSHVNFNHKNVSCVRCTACNEPFPTVRSLTLHVNKVHSVLRKHNCDVCEKKFQTKKSLIAHNKKFH